MSGAPKIDVEERLLGLSREVAGGCREWTSSRDKSGYGRIFYEGKNASAHRVAYTLWKGPIPEGLQIDHRCRNRACINPEHLDVVTPAENSRRAFEGRARVDTCKRGHVYDEENTRWLGKSRACKACQRELARGKYVKRGFSPEERERRSKRALAELIAPRIEAARLRGIAEALEAFHEHGSFDVARAA